jgi:hypothetical protein
MDRTYAAGFPAKPDPVLSVDRERPALDHMISLRSKRFTICKS